MPALVPRCLQRVWRRRGFGQLRNGCLSRVTGRWARSVGSSCPDPAAQTFQPRSSAAAEPSPLADPRRTLRELPEEKKTCSFLVTF